MTSCSTPVSRSASRSCCTDGEVDDGAQAGPLLDQVAGTLALFIGDSGYYQERVYASVETRHPEAAVIVLLHATAVPSEMAETEPTQCDHPLPRPAPPLARYPPRR